MTPANTELLIISIIPGVIHGLVSIQRLKKLVRDVQHNQVYSLKNSITLLTFAVGFILAYCIFFLPKYYFADPKAINMSLGLLVESLGWGVLICISPLLTFDLGPAKKIGLRLLIDLFLNEMSTSLINSYRRKSVMVREDLKREILYRQRPLEVKAGIARLSHYLSSRPTEIQDALGPSPRPLDKIQTVHNEKPKTLIDSFKSALKEGAAMPTDEEIDDLIFSISFVPRDDMEYIISGFGCEMTLAAFQAGKYGNYSHFT